MPRIPLLDTARGLALVAMTVFHFNFDLELLGVKPAGYINQTHWVVFARAIAASFLFLVGIGLVLAHEGGTNWPRFGLRLAKISAAAAVITIATWFATPNVFIFFGILHCIAVASLLGLLFLRLPWFITLAIAVIWLPARPYLQTPILDDPIWWWSGLSQFIPKSSDYVPLFPWFGCVLVGIGVGKFALERELLNSLTYSGKGVLPRGLAFMGRHSLLYYLAHQPIMIGGLIALLWMTGN